MHISEVCIEVASRYRHYFATSYEEGKTAEFSVIKQQELQTHRAGHVTPTRESHLEKKHRYGPEYKREV
jgi:hypothetical protein